MKETKSHDALHNQMLSLVGEISVSFAKIELGLNQFIAVLMAFPDPDTAEMVTDKLTFRQTLDLFRRLAKRSLAPLQLEDEANTLANHLETASNLRNSILHASPYTEERDADRIQFEKVRKRHLKAHESICTAYSIQKIEEIRNKIARAESELRMKTDTIGRRLRAEQAKNEDRLLQQAP